MSPQSSLEGDEVTEVLQSSTFELPEELESLDGRRFAAGSAEVRQVMRREGLSFDEARLQLVHSRMAQMGVDPSGMPLDPKTVTWDRPLQAPSRRKESAAAAQPREETEAFAGEEAQLLPFGRLTRRASKSDKPLRMAPKVLLAQGVLLLFTVIAGLTLGGWSAGFKHVSLPAQVMEGADLEGSLIP
eukprot:gnl/TRDRNA2_/TRDRNA2_186625_c0_seq1.p1 gnl/TRDRNA2_/TRDRNA2_186625_c0~~gnl/TRDRNA2_/TRDRNA2_186625_c0_seq1.p1  ORF type:complete len:187 (-),score=42.60 gnl/TRDRNA2_/TRDRNA2_186625_c0_seq1:176-736(-)